jgi:hypothetical protein
MKKINHFYISYPGNKRKELPLIYDKLNFDGIKKIIEPFCGSVAFSFYISKKQPRKFKYILNDKEKYLKDMYEIMIDENKIKDFENIINNELENLIEKEKYNEFTKRKDIYGWFVKNKYYRLRPGLFHMKTKLKQIDLKKTYIYEFFNNEDIEFYNEDGLDIYKKYCNDSENMIFHDPPYLNRCNTFYSNQIVNIYEYLFKNNIKNEKAKIYLILENNWIIQLLFDGCNKIEYDKKYSVNFSKNTNVKHVFISNI